MTGPEIKPTPGCRGFQIKTRVGSALLQFLQDFRASAMAGGYAPRTPQEDQKRNGPPAKPWLGSAGPCRDMALAAPYRGPGGRPAFETPVPAVGRQGDTGVGATGNVVSV